MNRESLLKRAIPFLLLILSAAGQGLAQRTFTDPQKRFVIDLPEGWRHKPFKPEPKNKDAVCVFEGEGEIFFVAFTPGVNDPDKLIVQAAYPLRSLGLYADGSLVGLTINGHPARWGVLRTRLDPGEIFLTGSVALGPDGAFLFSATRLDRPASLRTKVERSFQTLRMIGEIVTEPGQAEPIDDPSWPPTPTSAAQVEAAAANAPRPLSEEAQNKIRRGDNDLARGDYAKAAQYYSEAIAEAPDAVEAYFKRAWAYLKGRDFGKALADAAKALEIDPSYKVAYFARGLAYLELAWDRRLAREDAAAGLLEKAVADLTLAQSADFNTVKLYPNFYFFNDPPHLEVLYSLGRAYDLKGDLERALAAYSSAYEKGLLDSRHSIDQALKNLFDDFDRQKKDIVVGDSPRTLCLLGGHYSTSRPDLAIRLLSRALSLTQDRFISLEAYQFRSIAHAAQGDFVSAIADADAAIGIWARPQSYVHRAGILEKKGEFGRAADDYSKAIQAQRKIDRTETKIGASDGFQPWELYELFQGRARQWTLAKSWDKAIADYKTMIDMLTPDSTQALAWIYRELALIYEVGKGDRKKAEDYRRKARALDPQIKK